MLAKTVAFLLQFLLFLVVFGAGSVFLPFFPLLPVWQVQTSPGRAFVMDGLVFAAILWLLILGFEAAGKRIVRSGLRTSLAFALALALGLLMRFGFRSV